MTSIYLATAFLDGPLLAARVAVDLPEHGLAVPTGAQWWRWPECAHDPTPGWEKQRAQTLVIRAEHEIERCGRILVLLTDACGVGTGYEIAYARMAGLPIYWLDCGRTREIPPVLAGYGIKVGSLKELAERIREVQDA